MPINIDANIENADWTKKTWDLPTNKEDFLKHLKTSKLSLEDFKKLPVYKHNLDKIKWLKEL